MAAACQQILGTFGTSLPVLNTLLTVFALYLIAVIRDRQDKLGKRTEQVHSIVAHVAEAAGVPVPTPEEAGGSNAAPAK